MTKEQLEKVIDSIATLIKEILSEMFGLDEEGGTESSSGSSPEQEGP